MPYSVRAVPVLYGDGNIYISSATRYARYNHDASNRHSQATCFRILGMSAITDVAQLRQLKSHPRMTAL
jgi:hypothetical protein